MYKCGTCELSNFNLVTILFIQGISLEEAGKFQKGDI